MEGERAAGSDYCVTKSVYKALKILGEKDEIADRLASKIVESLEDRYGGWEPSVDDVRDLIERTLIEFNQAKVPEPQLPKDLQRTVRQEKAGFLNVSGVVDGYLERRDWRVKENSNSSYSLSGLMLHLSGSVMANYVLDTIYPPEVSQAHRDGAIHIHDLGMGIGGYCAGWSLRKLLIEGFNGVPNRVSSNPPAHLDTALLQMVNFLGTLQNEFAGAQAFNSVDTYLAPFVRADGLDYESVEQAMQTFVFNLNVTSRWGSQTPFTNMTFDWTVPDHLEGEHIIIKGKPQDGTYEDYQEEVDMINKAFIAVMLKGDMSGRPFTFPIPTYNITPNFPWEEESADMLFDMTAKYGLPYFQNFVNSNMKPEDVRSLCCRLRLDLRELKRNITGGLFGSSDMTGSVGVVTINMPRIGYLSKDEDEFFDRLEQVMVIAKTSLEIKREVVEKNMERGLLPYTKRYLGSLDNYFSTIGLVGMNEAILNLLGISIVSEEGRRFAIRTLKFMLDKIRDFQEKTGHLYNLEATPAEGTCYRLARIDRRKYPKIITAGDNAPYYTNSTQLPVDAGLDLIDALEHQEPLQTLYTGGTVFHIFLGESLEDGSSSKNLIHKVMVNTKLPYITLTPSYSVCQEHGYLSGEHPRCPACGREMEVYSRVVGYYRPVANWNEGKLEEFKKRPKYERS